MITMKQVNDSLNKMDYISKAATLNMLHYDMWNALVDSKNFKEAYQEFKRDSDYVTCMSNAPVNEEDFPELMLDSENKIKKATVYAVNNNLINLEDISYLFE